RPQLWQQTRTSEVRAASRVLAVFPAVPTTTPTSRKIHQRRMSHPPMPARTPPITNTMIAPMKVLKMLNTPPPPRAAPTVRVVQLRIHPRLTRRDFREQCLKNDRGARSINGFHAQTRPSAELVRSLRAREAGGRGGARTDPRRTHARPR